MHLIIEHTWNYHKFNEDNIINAVIFPIAALRSNMFCLLFHNKRAEWRIQGFFHRFRWYTGLDLRFLSVPWNSIIFSEKNLEASGYVLNIKLYFHVVQKQHLICSRHVSELEEFDIWKKQKRIMIIIYLIVCKNKTPGYHRDILRPPVLFKMPF